MLSIYILNLFFIFFHENIIITKINTFEVKLNYAIKMFFHLRISFKIRKLRVKKKSRCKIHKWQT